MAHQIRITPSILNADFANLGAEIERISLASDLVHLDVMDDIFVPNFTFDFAHASEIISVSKLPVDAHLMVADVDQIAPKYAEVGCASVTIHAEATTDIRSTLKAIRSNGARASLALKPKTPLDPYLEFLDDLDMLLIMTVEPGFGGQKFMTDQLPKIAQARKAIGTKAIWLQVDGGVSLETIESAAAAGADTFVAGSAVFNSADPAQMVTILREKAQLAKN
jgi:ribulose-phosphate 3-epimerase|uniref:ribulose-phosphate 3-epimerase n=1 Tax=Candidatus Planktophila sp. TaxID=2175601 RepID=UPI004049DB3C